MMKLRVFLSANFSKTNRNSRKTVDYNKFSPYLLCFGMFDAF